MGGNRHLRVIKRDDYELYRIPLPLSLRRRTIRAHIRGQLEKLHPCFTARCETDTRLGIGRGGLVASVAVVDALCLAEYRRQFHGRLRLEGNGRRSVFDRAKRAKALLACVLLAVFAISAALMLFGRSRALPASGTAAALPAMRAAPEGPAATEPESPDAAAFLAAVLDALEQNGARVTGLSVSAQGSSVSVERCVAQPVLDAAQGMAGVTVSDVQYTGGVPSFVVSQDVGATGMHATPAGEAALTRGAGLGTLLRGVLQDHGAQIQVEQASGLGYALSVPAGRFAPCMAGLSAFCAEHGLDVGRVSYALLGTQVSLSFSLVAAGEGGVATHRLLSRYAPLTAQELEAVRPASPVVQRQKEPDARTVVGRVVQKDGTTIVFYAGSDGKITGERE